MSKSKSIAIALGTSLLLTGVAFAEVAPYVGAEVISNNQSYSASGLEKNRLSSGVFVGARVHKNFGVEAGYNLSAKKKQTGNLKTSFSNMYVDALGYYPIAEQVELIGLVGVGRLKAKAQNLPAGYVINPSILKAKIGLRLGIGAQYKVSDNLAVRVLARHQKVKNGLAKNNQSLGFGLTWSF